MTWCDTQCLEGAGGVGAASSVFTGALQLLAASQCLLTEPWPPQASLHNGSVVDVIIVGGGTGGSALAARLAETNLTVLLLEAGPDPPIESIVPIFNWDMFKSRYDWNYTTVDDRYSSQELLDHRQRLRLGRLLGGTGSINDNIYSRGFPDDYDQWADLIKDPAWNWNNVLPYFKKSEKLTDNIILNHTSSLKYHGTNGEIEVTGPTQLDYATQKIISAFKEFGFDTVVDRNNPEKIGISHLSFTVKDGKRQSSLTAMLNKVAHRKNVYVMKNAHVTKVLTKRNSAFGVRVLIEGQEWVFYAHKEVVVSAGVYNTAKLLMLSGIGPKEHLQHHGVHLVADLPVGDNLHDHFFVTTYMAADKGTCNNFKEVWEAIQYMYNHTGKYFIRSMVGIDYTVNGSSTPNIPDYSIFTECRPVKVNIFGECNREHNYPADICLNLNSTNQIHEIIQSKVVLLQPKSRGSVRLASADPFDMPLIRSNALSNSKDLESFVEVIELVRSLTNTSYFKSMNAFNLDLGLKSCEGLGRRREYVECVVRSVVEPASQGAGTAALGAVVDGRLRVRGVRRLRVVDASVMPTIPHGNTNAAVIMVAEKAAEFIKQEYGLTKHFHL